MNSNPDLLDCVYCLPLKLLDSLVSRPLFSPLRLVEVLRGYTPKCLYVSRSFLKPAPLSLSGIQTPPLFDTSPPSCHGLLIHNKRKKSFDVVYAGLRPYCIDSWRRKTPLNSQTLAPFCTTSPPY
ncbi:hypothetical protein SCLCIDRAFT_837133 [Scleroderma citrinum Foug A]|uniref:Uncharacterized protein n=1 Tax=Scleroderma citrinum Foug A TaxID=1036808 RepID=A0A0C2ZL98_9AGAM|nr:hypothetical protein SCLCIDRAFT_837133 [Scleroderma citrinum Foug A]